MSADILLMGNVTDNSMFKTSKYILQTLDNRVLNKIHRTKTLAQYKARKVVLKAIQWFISDCLYLKHSSLLCRFNSSTFSKSTNLYIFKSVQLLFKDNVHDCILLQQAKHNYYISIIHFIK